MLATGAKYLRASKPETTYREKEKQEAQTFFSPPKDVKEFAEFEGADEPVACEQSIHEQVITPNRILRQSEYLQNNSAESPPHMLTDRSTSQTRAKIPYNNKVQPLWGKMMAKNVKINQAAGRVESFEN